MHLAHLTRASAIARALISIGAVLYAGDYSQSALILLGVIFAAWTAGPFALPYFRASELDDVPAASAVLFLATLAAAAFAAYVYWFTFVDNATPDAQDGIIMVVVPFYILVGLGVAVLIAEGIAKFMRSA